MGDWLVEQGVDQPKAERPKAPSLDAVRRQQSVLQRAAAAAAAPTPGAPGRQVGLLTACSYDCCWCLGVQGRGSESAGQGVGPFHEKLGRPWGPRMQRQAGCGSTSMTKACSGPPQAVAPLAI